MFKIFETYRSYGFPVTSDSFIKLHSAAHFNGSRFCGNETINGAPNTAIINGNNSTAWANEETSSPDNQYVFMEFVHKPVYVNTFYFHSLCDPPEQLTIAGSDDQQTWEVIGTHDYPIDNYSVTAIPCFQRKFYKYIKVNQSVNILNVSRLHIYNIDIYGTFEQEFQTCKHKKSFIHFCLFLFVWIK